MKCITCKDEASKIIRFWNHMRRLHEEHAFCQKHTEMWMKLWGNFPRDPEVRDA